MSDRTDRADGFEAGSDAATRPAIVTDEHLEFLDDLRESGRTNMYGAQPYLMGEFDGLNEEEAAMVLGYWMKSFGKANR